MYGDHCRHMHVGPNRQEDRRRCRSSEGRQDELDNVPATVRAAMLELNMALIERIRIPALQKYCNALVFEVHPDKHPGASPRTVQRLNMQVQGIYQARDVLVDHVTKKSSNGGACTSPEK